MIINKKIGDPKMKFFTRQKIRSLLMLLAGIVLPLFIYAQEWATYTAANSPVANAESIRDITADPVTGDVWIAAGTLLHKRTKDGHWTTYEAGTTPGLSYAGRIAAHNGKVWSGPALHSTEFSYFNGTVWQPVTIPNAAFFDIMDIEIADAFVWVATDRGLYQYDGQSWKKLDYEGKITQPTSVSWDATTSRLWVANNCVAVGRNVFRHNPADGSWTEYDTGWSGCGHAVQALPDGSAFYGSCNYSSILSVKNGTVSPAIQSACVYLDGVVLNPLTPGEVWFATEFNFGTQEVPSGLVRYDGNAVISTFNFKNSPMKGGGIEAIALQQTDHATAVIWMKTYKYDPGSTSTTRYLETYTYNTVTGIEEPENHDVQVFPIPAKDHFTVKVREHAPRHTPLKLSLYSVMGELIAERVLDEGEHEAVFSTSDLSRGIGLLRIGNEVVKVSLEP